MAYFAQVKNGVVQQVIVVPDDIEALGEARASEWIARTLGLDGTWVQTSYTGSQRARYAGIGDEWHGELDAFVSPKPEEFVSWALDPVTKRYRAPVDPPEGKRVSADVEWSERDLAWVDVVVPGATQEPEPPKDDVITTGGTR